MKHFGLGHILLLIVVGLLLGQATAELTAFQNIVPSAYVGQMVTVTVSLTYNGQTSTPAVVTPSLPYGVVANAGGQSTDLYPGITQQISYPLTAQQSGFYWIVSEISYAEDGTWRNLRLEAPFTATDYAANQPRPAPEQPSQVPTPDLGQDGPNPPAMPPDGGLPNGKQPGNMQPGNNGNEVSGHQDENAPAQGEGAAGPETNPM